MPFYICNAFATLSVQYKIVIIYLSNAKYFYFLIIIKFTHQLKRSYQNNFKVLNYLRNEY